MTHVLEALRNAGYEVIVNNEYHIQIPTSKGKHDIWFNQFGDIKFKPYGQQKAFLISLQNLVNDLKNYDYTKTDLGVMNVIKFIQNVPIKQGIFVDAGFKNGNAKIAIIRIQQGDIDVCVRNIKCDTNDEAEDAGIKMAMSLFPGDEPIYNDHQSVVARNAPRAKWINRKQNKEADRLSNLRGKDTKSLFDNA